MLPAEGGSRWGPIPFLVPQELAGLPSLALVFLFVPLGKVIYRQGDNFFTAGPLTLLDQVWILSPHPPTPPGPKSGRKGLWEASSIQLHPVPYLFFFLLGCLLFMTVGTPHPC